MRSKHMYEAHRSVVVALAAWLAAAPLQSALGAGARRLYSRDGVDVWAVGDAGLTLRSLDSGATWTVGNLGTANLSDVAVQGFTVWVTRADGVVQRSSDSGGTWSTTSLPGAPGLRAIEML